MNKAEKAIGAAVLFGLTLGGSIAINDHIEGNNSNKPVTTNMPTDTPGQEFSVPLVVEWGYQDYKYKGTQYRHQIKVLLDTNPEEGKRLQEKYNLLVKVNEGKEFLDDGEEFNPVTGDVFMIDDPSRTKAGVVLRHGPTIERSAGFSNAVYDGAAVAISGEGIEAKGFDYLQGVEIKTTLYPITVMIDSPKFQNADEAVYPETGYIPKEYLGAKIQSVNSGN